MVPPPASRGGAGAQLCLARSLDVNVSVPDARGRWFTSRCHGRESGIRPSMLAAQSAFVRKKVARYLLASFADVRSDGWRGRWVDRQVRT